MDGLEERLVVADGEPLKHHMICRPPPAPADTSGVFKTMSRKQFQEVLHVVIHNREQSGLVWTEQAR